MLDNLLASVLVADSGSTFSLASFLLCTATSLVLGLLIAAFYIFRSTYSKSFVITLALLPAIVQLVIMMVNGNIGAGIAVMGAFSLVRFRSIPGSAKEICSLFLAMAVGLATGMGYLLFAAMFAIIIGVVNMVLTVSKFGEKRDNERTLKITIPESLDYTGVFDDLFEKYTSKRTLEQVKTTNMGSLYKLDYRIVLRNAAEEKRFIDELRCRNGNLDISCGRGPVGHEGL